MPGPAGKHPSVRARRNNPKAGFTALPAAGRTGSVPSWPLPPDASVSAARDFAQDKVASLTADLERETDGRKRGGIKRQLATAEQSAAILSIQFEQQDDLEAELWSLLWSTPQAKIWEESTAFVRTLAQFVRWNVKGEQGNLDAAKEARIRGKEFGLTPLTLMGLKAEIERAEDAEAKGNRRRASQPRADRPDDNDPRAGLYAAS